MSRTLVIVPTYDERESLPVTLRQLLKLDREFDILVVDDDSPDGTGALAERHATDSSRIHVLHHGARRGLGAAYVAGFGWGLDRGYDRLVQMDADGSHRPADLPRLLDELDAGHDLAVGSRWVPGGRVENWPLARRLLSRAGSAYARLLLGLPVRDVTGGYRAFTASVLHRVELGSVTSRGYCFQIDLLRRAVRAQADIAEVPIVFRQRTAGRSKMSSSIVAEALVQVTRWAVRDRPRRRGLDRVSRRHTATPRKATAGRVPRLGE
ncbi:polyprenol monophosphomannose synthase [Schumannella luteola]|uniref:Dolichol-phosphate mannosyltransferase n=1 Tax=Schumannella luteola TaxID=472059 RepID=A0A852Y9K5_9MICO|nr:polyprenol monophosphomannose synthase [Schumannella luteola]NYG99113.1 dolichol-phosphate mannosyltransferase [Schumannella luteola]TPX02314.1 polyprenol monophosphomannose synthase [Schumannella luteola]